jgi:replication-associated recombination protein RarA
MWQDHWVEHPQAEQAVGLLRDMIVRSSRANWPNLLLSGPPGVGKTMIVDRFRAEHQVRIDDEGRPIVQIIKFDMTPPVEGRFWGAMLDALNVSYRDGDRVESKMRQAQDVLFSINCRLVVIDEIHNTLVGSVREQQSFLAILKTLLNQLGIPFVAIGTSKAMRALNTDDQLWKRFRTFQLTKMPLNKSFQGFLKAYEKHLPLSEPSNLWKADLAHAIHSRSHGGQLSEVTRLVRDAGVRALRMGDEAITLEHIKSDPYPLNAYGDEADDNTASFR